MGLGKTIQTLALVSRTGKTERNGQPCFCVRHQFVNNWKKEAEKFTPDLEIMIHHRQEEKNERLSQMKLKNQDL